MVTDYQPANPDWQEYARAIFSGQRFMSFLGVKIAAMHPGYCELALPYQDHLCQQHGFFHAGVIGALADNAAGGAAGTLIPAGANVLTVEYKLNLLAPAQGDSLVVRSRVIRAGRTLTVCQSEVFAMQADREQLCALAQVTLITLPAKHVAQSPSDE